MRSTMARREKRGYQGPGQRRAGGVPFHRRHRKLVLSVIGVLVVVLGTTTGYALWLNHRINSIPKVSTTAIEDRPDPDAGKALNILLLGSDKGERVKGENAKTNLAQDAAAKVWPNGKYRSDTLMIVHISADRRNVYLVSIPRDTYTMLYNAEGQPEHREKINGAFSYYGPNGAIATVEHLTNVRINHLAIIDWDGFKDLSTAVGGVQVYIPRSFYDPYQKIEWKAGVQTLEGRRALAYVRTRHGLLRGDFDRIARQQNFLRAMMKKMLSKGVTSNPVKLTRTLAAVTSNLTVDAEWDSADIRSLALGMRGISSDDVQFLTAPVADTRTIPVYGDIVDLDETKSPRLWYALRHDRMADYLRQYPDDKLGSDRDVS